MQRADQRKFHYIYKITRDDGRYYIGVHSTDDLDDGYFGSGQRLSRSIKKHGKQRHEKQIIEFLPTRAELRKREKEIITEELRSDPLCMNIAPGGGGGFIDSAHQRKCAAVGGKLGGRVAGKLNIKYAQAARPKSGEVYATNGFLGKKHSEISKQKFQSHSVESIIPNLVKDGLPMAP